MSLFAHKEKCRRRLDNETIVTPVGQFLPRAVFASVDTKYRTPDTSHGITHGGDLFAWEDDEAHLELLRVGLPFETPDGEVLGCQVAVWRFHVLRNMHSVLFDCSWIDFPLSAKGGVDCGEHLDAQTWDCLGHRIALGTEDTHSLAYRAKARYEMPARFARELSPSSRVRSDGIQVSTGLNVIQFLHDGIRVALPSLDPGERCQVHFVVAWGTPANENDRTAWFAIDIPAKKLVELGGCE